MRGLLPYAWRSLAARPARTVLTLVGIAIGVAVLVTALAVNGGLDASIQRTVASMVGRADLRISAFAETGLSDATLQAVADVPGVALTAPAIERRSFLAPQPGQSLSGRPVTILGIDPAREPRVRDLTLVRGAALSVIDEPAALITERLAAAEHLDVGGELSILGAGAPLHVRVVGVLAGDGPELGSSGRTVILPIGAAATLVRPDGATSGSLAGITRIDLVLATGADASTVTSDIIHALTSEPYVLSSPHEIVESLQASTADVRSTLALLAAITLFTAAFLILNTLAMIVVERIRELGLLRAAGAGRGQVIRIVVAQALALGTIGSLAGVGVGALLSRIAAAWLQASGSVDIDSPSLTPSVFAIAFASGLLITLVASLEPARRAAGVSPVTAMRVRGDPAAAVRARAAWLIAVMVAVGGLALLLLPSGASAGEGAARAAGVYAVLLLAVLVTPVFLRPLARVAGLPFGLIFGLEERLARAAISRDRGRTTLTVGALVVGLAMVVGLGTVTANARLAATAWLADVVPGDEVLTAIAPVRVGDGGVDAQVAKIDGVRLASPIATFNIAFQGSRVDAEAIRGADYEADGRLTFTAGDRSAALRALDAGGAVILPSSRAARMGVGVGDTLAVASVHGLVNLRVVGIVERSFPGRTGEAVLVGWSDALGRFGVQGADAIAVRFAPGRSATAAAAVADFARQQALTVAPLEQIGGALVDALDRVFGLLDLLAIAAVVVAALGIVNTISMDTWERVRELGMLRAAGMSRRQVSRSVIVEAGILGLIGGVMGSLAGIAIGALLLVTAGTRVEAGVGAPWPTIGLALVLGVSLAMLAAAQPARLAGTRSIVSALRGE